MTRQDAQALVGREFVHFKGKRYRLLGVAKHSETGGPTSRKDRLPGDKAGPGVRRGGLAVDGGRGEAGGGEERG